jgi:hypothetical protein
LFAGSSVDEFPAERHNAVEKLFAFGGTNRGTTPMRISSATIDCYLSISGGNNYTDFQHHHWDIMPSGLIGAGTTNNIPTYTWTVSSIGSDSNGSWSTPMSQSVTVSNGAEARITTPATSTTPGTVSLKQLTGFGVHNIQANGNKATTHPVSEMMWVTPAIPPATTGQDLITWNANAGTPSTITYQDMGHPTYQLQYGPPTVVPGGPTIVFPSGLQIQSSLLLANIILSSPSVVGGRDWTTGLATFYAVPSPRSARAWWAWTIYLVM